MRQFSGPSGEFLLAVATLVSLQLAQGKSTDELVLIAAFFTVLGDNLALIAAARPTESTGTEDKKQAAVV